ncbi:MAG: ammonium transporter [Clostridia bacterium]|nr:ammonium transporter [Clostridia bacterium]
MNALLLAAEESTLASDVTTFAVWFLIGTALVFFMQCGFAMVETGLTRAKNAGNIIMKNLMDFCIGTVVFMLLGFGLLFGQDTLNYFIGAPSMGLFGDFHNFVSECGKEFIFNLVFCATAATIVSGAMAERTRFVSYCVYSALISLIVYPVEAGWVWGGGWLASFSSLTGLTNAAGAAINYIDYAGSSCIHMVGGCAALIGAIFEGARIGKFDRDANGKVTKTNAIQGHSMTLAALGVFILWFGWYGFNGAAATSVDELVTIFINTTIAPAVATCTALVFTWVRNKKPDVGMCLNGSLAGLVGITAGCSCMDPVGAVVVGLVSGLLVIGVCSLLDNRLHVDDPVGAVGVHFANGIWGTLACGLFATDTGLFYGGGWAQLGVQTLGVVSILAWAAIWMIVIFYCIKYVPVMVKFKCGPIKAVKVAKEKGWNGLRCAPEDEIVGLDMTEHGLPSAYADFMPTIPSYDGEEHELDLSDVVPADIDLAAEGAGGRYTQISIITNQEKFLLLKDAMAGIGVTGMTVSTVMGCGIQGGKTGQYRGVKTSMHLNPKVKVDIVVSTVDPGLVVAVARKVLDDGKIGAGKIFVTDVEDVMRIRTGETGVAALDNTPPDETKAPEGEKTLESAKT